MRRVGPTSFDVVPTSFDRKCDTKTVRRSRTRVANPGRPPCAAAKLPDHVARLPETKVRRSRTRVTIPGRPACATAKLPEHVVSMWLIALRS